MAVKVAPLDPLLHEEWDQFVEAHEHGSPFHLIAWQRSIAQTFGYKPKHLVATRGGRVCGVLPLFLINNRLIGKVLLSSPFAVYGGALFEGADVRAAFRASLRWTGESLGVQYVELRNAFEGQSLGFAPLPRYVTFTQELPSDEEALLSAIPRKTRYMIRKALREPFSTRIQTCRSLAFEKQYGANLQRLGTPQFPARHFVNLFANFRDRIDVRETVLEGKVVAAVLSFSFRNHLLPYYGASDASGNSHAASNFMYYDLMRWAIDKGYRTFDFGRSKKDGGGSYDFKSHWGMTERELPYEVMLVRRKELPNYSPANPKFSLPIRMWRRMPAAVAKLFGPALIRLVP